MRSLRSFTLLASCALVAACSGTPVEKANTGLETTTPSGSSTVPTTDPGTGDPGTTSSGADAGAGASSDATTSPPTTQATYDAGAPTVVDAGDFGGGDIPCVENGTLEAEPNDDAILANDLAPTICGAVLPGSESDFLKFTLKPTTQSMYLDYAGSVTLTVTVDGKTVTLAPGSAPKLPFVKGHEYSVEVRAADQNRQNYRVTLFER